MLPEEPKIIALRWIPAAVGLIFGAKYLFLFATSSPERIILMNADDAYYYYEIARNFIDTGNLTFDGEHITTGVQPLWFLLVASVFAVIDGQIIPLRVMGVLSTGLLTIGLVGAVYYLVQREFTVWTGSAVLAVTFYILLAARITMESSLVLPVAIALLWYTDRTSYPDLVAMSNREVFALGIGVAVVQLARLDAVLLSVLCVGWAVVRTAQKSGVIAAVRLRLVAPPLLTGGGYLLTLWLLTNRIRPTSAIAKSIGSGLNEKLLDNIYEVIIMEWSAVGISDIYGFGLIGIAALYILLTRFDERTAPPSSVLAAVFALAHLIYYVTASQYPLHPWYVYPSALVGIFVLPQLPASGIFRPRQTSSFKSMTAVVTIIVILVAGTIVVPVEGFQHDNYEVAQYTNQELPSNATIAWGNGAASFAYFSHHRVIQTEGLVMHPTYLDALQQQRVRRYLVNSETTYLVGWHSYQYNGKIGSYYPHPYWNGSEITVHRRCELKLPNQLDSYVGAIWRVECLAEVNQISR